MTTTENKAEIKKQNSYTYWVEENKQYFEGIEKPDIDPKVVDGPIEAKKKDENKISQWNTHGTWEEKDFKMDKVHKFVNTKLTGKIIDNLEIINFKDLTGRMNMIFSRGKMRLGYEIEAKIEQKEKNTTSQGTLNIKDLLDYEEEAEIKAEGL